MGAAGPATVGGASFAHDAGSTRPPHGAEAHRRRRAARGGRAARPRQNAGVERTACIPAAPPAGCAQRRRPREIGAERGVSAGCRCPSSPPRAAAGTPRGHRRRAAGLRSARGRVTALRPRILCSACIRRTSEERGAGAARSCRVDLRALARQQGGGGAVLDARAVGEDEDAAEEVGEGESPVGDGDEARVAEALVGGRRGRRADAACSVCAAGSSRRTRRVEWRWRWQPREHDQLQLSRRHADAAGANLGCRAAAGGARRSPDEPRQPQRGAACASAERSPSIGVPRLQRERRREQQRLLSSRIQRRRGRALIGRMPVRRSPSAGAGGSWSRSAATKVDLPAP